MAPSPSTATPSWIFNAKSQVASLGSGLHALHSPLRSGQSLQRGKSSGNSTIVRCTAALTFAVLCCALVDVLKLTCLSRGAVGTARELTLGMPWLCRVIAFSTAASALAVSPSIFTEFTSLMAFGPSPTLDVVVTVPILDAPVLTLAKAWFWRPVSLSMASGAFELGLAAARIVDGTRLGLRRERLPAKYPGPVCTTPWRPSSAAGTTDACLLPRTREKNRPIEIIAVWIAPVAAGT